jgi:hypothetical protein
MGDKTPLEEIVEKRNRYALQAAGLRRRVDRLHRKIELLDAEIHDLRG